MSRYLVLLTVFLFTGCSIVPDSIEVPEGTQLVSYSKAVTSGANASASACIGTAVGSSSSC